MGTSSADLREESRTSEQQGLTTDSEHPSECTTNPLSIMEKTNKRDGSGEIDDTGDPKSSTLAGPPVLSSTCEVIRQTHDQEKPIQPPNNLSNLLSEESLFTDGPQNPIHSAMKVAPSELPSTCEESLYTDDLEKLVQSTMNLSDLPSEESPHADGPEMTQQATMMVHSTNVPDLVVTRTADECCYTDDQEKTIVPQRYSSCGGANHGCDQVW